MQAEVTDLIEEGDRVVGLRVQAADGPREIHADLVIGADGRHSIVRDRAGLRVTNIGAPIDVLWMRLSKKPGDPAQTAGRFNYGRLLVMLDRGDYWQCAFVIRKGGYDAIRGRGLDSFRSELLRLAPLLHDRVAELKDWDDIKLLTVAIDRLEQWWRPAFVHRRCSSCDVAGRWGRDKPGNQDAVATAKHSGRPLAADAEYRRSRRGAKTPHLPDENDPALQVVVQERILGRILGNDEPIKAPWPVRLFNMFPILRRIPARLTAWGFAGARTDTGAPPNEAMARS